MNGEYRNTIDEKGRLMIPPKLREQLGSYTLMLTKSMDNSLWLYTKEDFEALNREVNYGPLSVFNRNSRMIDMMVISPAREVELDKTGRLSIPQILREYAGLEPKSGGRHNFCKSFFDFQSVTRHYQKAGGTKTAHFQSIYQPDFHQANFVNPPEGLRCSFGDGSEAVRKRAAIFKQISSLANQAQR